MAATYVPGRGSRDRVRMLIPDNHCGDPQAPEVVTDAIFSDAELDDFLLMEGADVRLAVAQALDTIGSSEVRILKTVRLRIGRETDGAAVSR